MVSSWLLIVGTLGGATIGLFGGLLSEKMRWRNTANLALRESLIECYTNFLAQAAAVHITVVRLASSEPGDAEMISERFPAQYEALESA